MARLMAGGLICGFIGAIAGLGLATMLDIEKAVLQFSLCGAFFASAAGWQFIRSHYTTRS